MAGSCSSFPVRSSLYQSETSCTVLDLPQKRARLPPTVLAVISLSLRKHGAPKLRATAQLSSSGWVLSITFFLMSSTSLNGYALTAEEPCDHTNVHTACFTSTVALNSLCSVADRCTLLLFCDRHGPGWIPTRYRRATYGAISLA